MLLVLTTQEDIKNVLIINIFWYLPFVRGDIYAVGRWKPPCHNLHGLRAVVDDVTPGQRQKLLHKLENPIREVMIIGGIKAFGPHSYYIIHTNKCT